MEKITYLVANYNNGQYLKECIESLLAQTSSNWRCIIYDDFSTDNSISIIQSYIGDAIQLIEGKKNEGKINALKVMIEQSQTDILGILDSDDMLHPDTTREILNVYEKDGNAGFVYSKCAYMDETLLYVFNEIGNDVKSWKLRSMEGFISSLRTFRKKIYYKTSGFSNDMLYMEDVDLNYKLEEISTPIYINRALYKYRRLQDSQAHNKNNKRLGAKNHIKSRKNAFKRRNVRGLDWVQKIIYLYAENMSYLYPYSPYKKNIVYMIGRIVSIVNKLFKTVTRL